MNKMNKEQVKEILESVIEKVIEKIKNNPSSLLVVIVGIISAILSMVQPSWLSQNFVFALILAMMSLLALDSLMYRNNKFDKIEEQLRNLKNPSSPIYAGYVKIFGSEEEWYDYVSCQISSAKSIIRDASLTQRLEDAIKSDAANNYYNNRRKIIKSTSCASSKLCYLYVATYSDGKDEERYSMVKEYRKLSGNFKAKALEIDKNILAALNIVIIDEKEVIIGLTPPAKRYRSIAIEHPEIVNMFIDYYAKLWEAATIIDPELDKKIRDRVGIKNQSSV